MKTAASILAGLERARAEGRLHHAYLLAGPETGDKSSVVEKFAAGFAASGAEENALRRISQDSHPDFVRFRPVNDLLGVDDMRTLPKALAFPPLELGRRVVLVEGAQTLNGQASNAILKILEEPPGHSMFFLLVREPSELLQTIVSRSQVIRFPPSSEEGMRAELNEADPVRLAAALLHGEGSRARAEAFLALEGAVETQNAAADVLVTVWEAAPRIPSAAVQWAEALGEDFCELAVDTWQLVLRDLAFAASNAPASSFRFPQLHARLSALAQNAGPGLPEEAAAKGALLNRFRVHRDFNGNLRLNFAALLSEMQLSVGKPTGPRVN